MPNETTNYDVLSALQFDANNSFATRIPQVTRDNIATIGNAIMNNTETKNAFLTSLTNKIGLTIVNNKIYENKLAFFKGEFLEFGDTIEEIVVDLIKQDAYNPKAETSSDLDPFKKNNPNAKPCYHKIDRQATYCVTINSKELKKAFTNKNGLSKVISAITNQLLSSRQYDEYVQTKELLGSFDGFYEIAIQPFESGLDADNQASAKALTKAIKWASSEISYMKTSYNKEGKATFTPKDNQVLLVHKDAKLAIDLDYLAGLFNMEKAQMLSSGKVVEVDDFGSKENCFAMLVDQDAVRIHYSEDYTESITNPRGRYTNTFVHCDACYSMSPYRNAIAFVASETTPDESAGE